MAFYSPKSLKCYFLVMNVFTVTVPPTGRNRWLSIWQATYNEGLKWAVVLLVGCSDRIYLCDSHWSKIIKNVFYFARHFKQCSEAAKLPKDVRFAPVYIEKQIKSSAVGSIMTSFTDKVNLTRRYIFRETCLIFKSQALDTMRLIGKLSQRHWINTVK